MWAEAKCRLLGVPSELRTRALIAGKAGEGRGAVRRRTPEGLLSFVPQPTSGGVPANPNARCLLNTHTHKKKLKEGIISGCAVCAGKNIKDAGAPLASEPPVCVSASLLWAPEPALEMGALVTMHSPSDGWRV